MACQTEMALLERCVEAANGYLDALKPLMSADGYEQFEKLMERVNEARAQCVQAHKEVERHRKRHGCGS